MPLQPVKTLGNDGENRWYNVIIFGDNLQAMKTLLPGKKKAGDELRPRRISYKLAKGGTLDKYAARHLMGSNLVRLEPAFAQAFLFQMKPQRR